MTRTQRAARLFARADRIEFPYGFDVPPAVLVRVEALRDRAERLSP